MVTLLHMNRKLDFFLFAAVKVVSGKDNECPVLYGLVKQFVEAVGKGVMKRLILDRGFLNGKAISTCKKDYGIDVLIPVRRNMDIHEDAMALFQLPEVKWVSCKDNEVEVKKSARLRPKVIAKREQYTDGHEEVWPLIDTKEVEDPTQSRQANCYRGRVPSA
ncbi:MAG: transposase [Deltaproteobacteria bacterium]|nr:transposase [Deltaproteobacteria bacterium]